jgi:hypothetical protein
MHKSCFAALGSALLLAASALAQSTDNDSCTDATLKGDYAFKVSGQILPPGQPAVQRDGVAMTHFDGHGNLTQVDFIMSNGSPTAGPTDPVTGFHIGETGSYSVFADCTGVAQIIFPAPPGTSSGAVIDLMFVLSDRGRNIHTIVTKLVPHGSSSPLPATIHSDAEKLDSLVRHPPEPCCEGR